MLTFEEFEKTCYHTQYNIVIPLVNRMQINKLEFFTKASGVVKVVNKMLSDQIRDLELTIKSTEAGLVAKRNLLNELLLKQSESEKV